MEQLTINDITETLTDDIVYIMREMESQQTQEWRILWNALTSKQKDQYSDIKIRQRRTEVRIEREKIPQDERDQTDRSQLYYMVMHRHPSDLSLEEIFQLTFDKGLSLDNIQENLGEGTYQIVKSRRNFITRNEEFSFFWTSDSPFSQWYNCDFKGDTFIWGRKETKKERLAGMFPLNEQIYSSAEQFMMYHKAMLFLDRKNAKKIMETDNPREIKRLGKEVKHFDETTWEYYRSDIVYMANKYKFSQNESLLQHLYNTSGTSLVEASPYDSIWGIGLKESSSKAKNRNAWQGKNLLGEILTHLRIEFVGKY